jgi:hypothetical protein
MSTTRKAAHGYPWHTTTNSTPSCRHVIAVCILKRNPSPVHQVGSAFPPKLLTRGTELCRLKQRNVTRASLSHSHPHTRSTALGTFAVALLAAERRNILLQPRAGYDSRLQQKKRSTLASAGGPHIYSCNVGPAKQAIINKKFK